MIQILVLKLLYARPSCSIILKHNLRFHHEARVHSLIERWRGSCSFSQAASFLSTSSLCPHQDGPLICRAVEPLFVGDAETANSSFDTF